MPEFDPNAAAAPGSGLFGLPDQAPGGGPARVHILPVPFDATTSYRRGTAHGPEAVLAASHQVDLFDLHFGRPYEAGIVLAPFEERVAQWNRAASQAAEPVLSVGGAGSDPDLLAAAGEADRIGAALNEWVRERTSEALERGQLPGLLGGDHATPFGAIAACVERHPGLGILHFDAHADLRPAYEGLRWSHASILHNVLEQLDVARLVQVGVRDLCEQERDAIQGSEGRIQTLFDPTWAQARLCGQDLRPLVRATLAELPETVYLTFDVDGLDPQLCPQTGTPVPGGLDWHSAMLWLDELAQSGKRVVGFDLVEVSPGPEPDPEGTSWDAIVGARLLYRLIGCALRSSPTSGPR